VGQSYIAGRTKISGGIVAGGIIAGDVVIPGDKMKDLRKDKVD